jgi:hypothetical protein
MTGPTFAPVTPRATVSGGMARAIVAARAEVRDTAPGAGWCGSAGCSGRCAPEPTGHRSHPEHGKPWTWRMLAHSHREGHGCPRCIAERLGA